jgi:hypothetical protein
MKNLKNQALAIDEDNPKQQYKQDYQRKKQTQKAAKDRRQFIKDLKESRWK